MKFVVKSNMLSFPKLHEILDCQQNVIYSIIIYYYYINLRSSIIFCLFSVDIYLSLCISQPCSVFSSELFCGQFETSLILPAFLFRIQSPVDSVIFLIALYQEVLSASVTDFLA